MITEPLVAVRCAVCAGEGYEVICPAREVQAHQEYLRRFHRRRLRPGASSNALADRAEFTQGYATDIVSCMGCGLVYRNPRPSDAAIAEAYARDQYGTERLEELFASQLPFYRPKVRQLRRWLRPGARVVEVGSFVGGFLAAGSDQGWSMLGIDPGAEVDAFCSRRGLPVHRGTLYEVPLNAGSVDGIAIWNTFDQLPDPEPTLAAARRLLRPGGVLALRLPNGECFRWAERWMPRLPRQLRGWLRAAMAWNNLLAFPYLHGYTVRTLDWLLAWHGLERVMAQPDVLPRLADEQTQRWAAGEEWTVKLLCLMAAKLEGARPSGGLRLAPWFDAYYLKLTDNKGGVVHR